MEGIGDHKIDSGCIFGLSITVVHFLREAGKLWEGTFASMMKEF
jgi:hypothetical protein